MNSESWAAQRWLEPIVQHGEIRAQIRKGRIIARKGWVKNLTVRPGLVTAEVQTDDGATCSVKVRMPTITDQIWEEIVGEMSKKAGFAASLLAGRMSEEVVDVFGEAGVDLFPFDLRDVTNFSSCGSDRLISVHAVATHFALADAMAADPFVLLEFRGRTREQLMKELRAQRSGGLGEPDEEGEEERSCEGWEAVSEGYWARGVVPHLAFRFTHDELDDEETLPVVRALGPGPAETAPEDVAKVLAPLARMGRRRVVEIVERMAADSDSLGSPDLSAAEGLDDLLVAAAHQHGALTSGFVADALGISSQEARRYLKWLVEEGRLQVVGRARGTKYIPAGASALPEKVPAVGGA